MAKTRDYSDFKKFAKKNKNLSRTKIIEEYRKQGGKIQKQKGLEIIRELFDIKKREQIGKSVKTINTTKRKNSYISAYKSKKDVTVMSLKNSHIRDFYNRIHDMYENSGNTFISINVVINDDDFTSNKHFSVFIPFNYRQKQGVKAVGEKILDNLFVFYSNLAKMYSTKNDMVGDVFNTIKNTRKQLRKSHFIDYQELQRIFGASEINIGDISIIHFIE